MSFYSTPLLTWTSRGLYCEAGDFYIDPHGRMKGVVKTAIVTHAHSDHARRGSDHYICEASGLGLLKTRLGQNISAEGIPYGQAFKLGAVTVSLHSAGHILGSAQVRIEHEGEVWLASGDYKRDADPSCLPFETVKCDTFITEATFGTPKFVWDKNLAHGSMIHEWWMEAAAKNRNCILFGYSLGKAQRILGELAPFAHRPVLIHRSIEELTECYRGEGVVLAPTHSLGAAIENCKTENKKLEGELILAPPSILDESWMQWLGAYETAFASGWMQGSGPRGRYDRGFVMSDHADWNDLNRTIDETGASRVFVQHRDGALISHLRKRGIEAHAIEALSPENYHRLGGKTLDLFGASL